MLRGPLFLSGSPWPLTFVKLCVFVGNYLKFAFITRSTLPPKILRMDFLE